MPEKTLREILEEYNTSKGYSTDEKSLQESFYECFKTVWSDSYIDNHRWYSVQMKVMEIDGRFFMYADYMITGDHSLFDMGLERDKIDDIEEVYPHTVTTTIYKSEKP
jgi:hypothetical protein